MQKITIFLFALCLLSTQVFGSVAFEDHHHQGDAHSLMHEVGQPHSHEHEDVSQFEVSFSDEAYEHINAELESNLVAIHEIFTSHLSEMKPVNRVGLHVDDWSPPFLRHIKPPPKF